MHISIVCFLNSNDYCFAKHCRLGNFSWHRPYCGVFTVLLIGKLVKSLSMFFLVVIFSHFPGFCFLCCLSSVMINHPSLAVINPQAIGELLVQVLLSVSISISLVLVYFLLVYYKIQV